jgi:maltokinase
MNSRLDAALEVVPELAPYADGLRARFAELGELDEPIPVQRVHGDYHLGQVLRTHLGWTILDFEGEPARPLAARRGLDSPIRDIAGMLRSFEYAARHLLVEGHSDPQLEYRANEWAGRNRQAFCDGYANVAGRDPSEQPALVRAFEADKAVYEAVYEARNRPHWLPIPLNSLAKLAQLA